jgi:Flp pilus assembly protein TadG
MLKREEGSSLIELAVILPMLLLLLVGAVDFGRGYFMSIEVSSASEAGALYGVQNSSDVAGMTAAAKLDGADVPGLTASATQGCECSDGSGATPSCSSTPVCSGTVVGYVEVTTQSTYQPLLGYPGLPTSMPLSGRTRLRLSQ